MYICLQVKYLLFLSDFNQIWIILTYFKKILNIKLHDNPSTTSHVVQCWCKEKYYEANSCFSQCCKTCLNTIVSTVSNHYVNFLILSHFYTQLPHLQSNAQQDMFDCENYIKVDWYNLLFWGNLLPLCSTVQMKAAASSKTFINFYQTIWHHIP
jgi:hypothetical protein